MLNAYRKLISEQGDSQAALRNHSTKQRAAAYLAESLRTSRGCAWLANPMRCATPPGPRGCARCRCLRRFAPAKRADQLFNLTPVPLGLRFVRYFFWFVIMAIKRPGLCCRHLCAGSRAGLRRMC